MDQEVLSDPLVAAALLFVLAALILIPGLALQAGANRRRGGGRPVSEGTGKVAVPDRGEGLPVVEGPVTRGGTPEDRRRIEELEARIEEVEERFEARIEEVEDELDAGIDEVEAKIARAIGPVTSGELRWMEEFGARIKEVDVKIHEVDAKIHEVDAKAATVAKPVTNNRPPEDRRRIEEPADANGSDRELPADRRWVEEFVARTKAVDAKIARANETSRRTLGLDDNGSDAGRDRGDPGSNLRR